MRHNSDTSIHSKLILNQARGAGRWPAPLQGTTKLEEESSNTTRVHGEEHPRVWGSRLHVVYTWASRWGEDSIGRRRRSDSSDVGVEDARCMHETMRV